MTADDLRTRAEAASLKRAPRHHIFESSNANAHYRAGFMDGFKWHAAQQPTLDVDELVVVLHDAACVCDRTTHPAESWVNWTNYARAVVAHLTKGDENDE